MIDTTSSFIKSSIPLYHNAVKSIIFKCAELLMGIFIYKLFSLIAALSNQFTSYLMFTEDYIQRTLYISSRGLSRAGLVVLSFSLLNIALSLYGTLLWALDSPGYIFRASIATIADYEDQRNDNPPYIVQLSLDSTQLLETEQKLSQIIGAELFNPGLNYTLTGQFTNSHGTPEVVAPTRQVGVGARIWLDDDGLSVSPDTVAMFPGLSSAASDAFPICIIFDKGSAAWNCTFRNVFAEDIVEKITGLPEVHWDDTTDKELDSRYIRPSRVDNIWYSFGGGASGPALMNQVFTVTKKKRRHTFMQSTFRASMLTGPETPFARKEVTDLVQRTWSANETERSDPLIGRIVNNMMSAQTRNISHHFGANAMANDNKTVVQSNWGFYSIEPNGEHLYSLISITTTNITLIRSETISKAPQPFQECGKSNFQNEAFGGKVARTDCAASIAAASKPSFFGQVDTAAVMVAHGLGDSRSNISAEALDNKVLSWLQRTSEIMESLLIARAYTVGIDPSLVEIRTSTLIIAMSRLQLTLSCLAFLLAAVLWLGLIIFADAHWANTLLANLIYTTSESKGAGPGYIMRAPDVTLQSGGRKKLMAVGGKAISLYDPAAVPLHPMVSPAPYIGDPKSYGETRVFPVGYNNPNTGEAGLLSKEEQDHWYTG